MKIVLCRAVDSPIGVVASVRDQVLAQATGSTPTYCYLEAPWARRGKVEKAPRQRAGFNAIAVVDCPNPELLTDCVVLPGDISSPRELHAALEKMQPTDAVRSAGFRAVGNLRAALTDVLDYA